ncbi:GNAT family N-acetyltransferase [Deinococcus arenicola]|uniref:GNAT family N-acetyltransferase n=1 Tax=Deinococcus arenicola TaxID=2994950 RepID=A0ABU4DKT6_9DEIO|nr:GNAT family N-acetyltransferase [Deinococcus sp. ZS9-10]MDV6373037.1 GNAT family N-acetyltransferase [Deinococcus sp. ZS9-10]
MLTDHWPLFALKLQTASLELRPPNDEELAAIADVAAKGIHAPDQRPFLTPWTHLPPAERALYVIQQHWLSRAQWQPEAWSLGLGVFHGGQPIGLVSLRGRDFPILREVKTGSWLGLEFQGQGYGTEARAALLHLAFAELGAVAALSEVFQDNVGSQGVSRRLGYKNDGISRDVLDGQPVVSDRLRLTREDWERNHSVPVLVTGLEAGRRFFQSRPGASLPT